MCDYIVGDKCLYMLFVDFFLSLDFEEEKNLQWNLYKSKLGKLLYLANKKYV
jgi:hypothetical protein